MKVTLLLLRKKRKKSEKCNEIFCFTNIAFFFFFFFGWEREIHLNKKQNLRLCLERGFWYSQTTMNKIYSRNLLSPNPIPLHFLYKIRPSTWHSWLTKTSKYIRRIRARKTHHHYHIYMHTHHHLQPQLNSPQEYSAGQASRTLDANQIDH